MSDQSSGVQTNSVAEESINIQAIPIGGDTTEIIGEVSKKIGTGANAKNSIVYNTIFWSFAGGGLITVVVVIAAFFRGSTDMPSQIKDVWAIFTPLITLSLGYLFGKNE